MRDRLPGPLSSSPLRTDRRTLLRAGLAAGALVAAPPIAHRAAAGDIPAAWSEPNGHTISGVFLDWWVENNRWAKIGHPVTEAVTDDGVTTQYFRFGALRTEDLAEADVELLDAGTLWFDDNPETPPAEGIIADPLDRIAETWRYNGGERRFGDAISDPVISDERVVQWYERGAVDIAAGGTEVMARVVPVGERLAKAAKVSTKRVDRDGLDLLRPVFRGDDLFVPADLAFDPVELYLPELGIDAAVERIGVAGGVMQTPAAPLNVGWYADHARPGTDGTTVMAGHVDWYEIGAAVFFTLPQAEPGMRFYALAADGAAATYECVDSYPIGAGGSGDNILRGTGVDSLALITCTGTFADGHYDQRQIVYAERI